MAALGVTPLMAMMTIRSDEMVTIYEELDKQWKILFESSIKAKSVRGYKTKNYKMTANKFALETPKPELLEDWDQRLVVSTVSLSEDGNRLTIKQIAEKDQRIKLD